MILAVVRLSFHLFGSFVYCSEAVYLFWPVDVGDNLPNVGLYMTAFFVIEFLFYPMSILSAFFMYTAGDSLLFAYYIGEIFGDLYILGYNLMVG